MRTCLRSGFKALSVTTVHTNSLWTLWRTLWFWWTWSWASGLFTVNHPHHTAADPWLTFDGGSQGWLKCGPFSVSSCHMMTFVSACRDRQYELCLFVCFSSHCICPTLRRLWSATCRQVWSTVWPPLSGLTSPKPSRVNLSVPSPALHPETYVCVAADSLSWLMSFYFSELITWQL